MATKKRKTTVKRVTRSTPSRTKTVKKVRRRKKGGMLSEFNLSNPAMTGSIKSAFSGMLGGVTAGLIQKMTVNQTQGVQIGALLIGSVVASWGLKAPNFGSGIAGASGLLIADSLGMLGEGKPVQWADDLQRLPMFLDENGNEMLAEGIPVADYSTPLGGFY